MRGCINPMPHQHVLEVLFLLFACSIVAPCCSSSEENLPRSRAVATAMDAIAQRSGNKDGQADAAGSNPSRIRGNRARIVYSQLGISNTVDIPPSGFVTIGYPSPVSCCDHGRMKFVIKAKRGRSYNVRLNKGHLLVDGLVAGIDLSRIKDPLMMNMGWGKHRMVSVLASDPASLKSETFRQITARKGTIVLVVNARNRSSSYLVKYVPYSKAILGLVLHQASIDHAAANAIAKLKRLEYLALVECNDIRNDAISHLRNSRRLKHLEISGGTGERIRINSFMSIPYLRSLSLRGLCVAGRISDSVAKRQRIKSLALVPSCVYKEIGQAVVSIAKGGNLQSCKLGRATNLTEAQIRELNESTRLDSFDVGEYVTLSEPHASNMLKLKSIRSFSTVGSHLSRRVSEAICRHKGIRSLSIIDASPSSLLHLEKCLTQKNSLRELFVSGKMPYTKSLGDSFVEKIGRVVTLRVLGITGYPVSKPQFLALKRLSRLEKLIVDSRNVSASLFNKQGVMRNIRSLWLTGQTVTDTTIRMISSGRNIRELEIDTARLSCSGLLELKELESLRKLIISDLDLRGCRIAHVSHKHLQWLSVTNAKLARDAHIKVDASPNLRYLNVSRGLNLRSVLGMLASRNLRVIGVGNMTGACTHKAVKMDNSGVVRICISQSSCLKGIAQAVREVKTAESVNLCRRVVK